MFNLSVVVSGTRITTKATLASREIFVGRSKKCHLVLRDETVSGVHCRLIAFEGGALVLDEGSTNGTLLNGELVVRPTIMTADDELRVGPYVLGVQSLVGGASAFSPPRRAESAQHIDPPLSVEARPAEERPRPQARPTELQISQAQVFWRILGFQEPATLEQARAAYEAQVKECCPDTASDLNPWLSERSEQRLREITFAWEYIQRLFRRGLEAA
ncbi:FHA domain-containing protein [Stigmatella sp. ncwal1]|uniref:FHA domain-containing protein n=1 Tax=Stigmatella ashevillensis TaxID=2995309 RepID=A0ABT5DA02_9BACT|nr:FHA domain-containing protein [Stigmatella ashevillena]MDC0709081.1 FHA domain-containing protein [Stigmatella ashevillena]